MATPSTAKQPANLRNGAMVTPIIVEAPGLTNRSAAQVLRKMAEYLDTHPDALPDTFNFYASPDTGDYVGIIYEID